MYADARGAAHGDSTTGRPDSVTAMLHAASVLGVSEATVHRDWRVARAWLRRELGTREMSDGR